VVLFFALKRSTCGGYRKPYGRRGTGSTMPRHHRFDRVVKPSTPSTFIGPCVVPFEFFPTAHEIWHIPPSTAYHLTCSRAPKCYEAPGPPETLPLPPPLRLSTPHDHPPGGGVPILGANFACRSPAAVHGTHDSIVPIEHSGKQWLAGKASGYSPHYSGSPPTLSVSTIFYAVFFRFKLPLGRVLQVGRLGFYQLPSRHRVLFPPRPLGRPLAARTWPASGSSGAPRRRGAPTATASSPSLAPGTPAPSSSPPGRHPPSSPVEGRAAPRYGWPNSRARIAPTGINFGRSPKIPKQNQPCLSPSSRKAQRDTSNSFSRSRTQALH